MPATRTVKTIDAKGRVSLGPDFANQQVILERVNETEVRVIAAAVIPQRELWLHQNAQARARVINGIAEARAGRLKKGPDLNAQDCGQDE